MKVKKILLIAPPAHTFKSYRDVNPLPPMGLGYLASVVADMGIEVKILDCLLDGWNKEEEAGDLLVRVGLSDKEIADRISDFDPDVVGVNCQFSRQYKIYHRVFSIIKKVKSGCVAVAGGPHATVCPEEILSDDNCDFLLLGEAEESLKDLLSHIANDGDLTGVDGLGWRSGGRLYINEKRGWTKNLDSLPFPAYDLMEIDKYFGLKASHGLRHKERFMPIMTSRGCPAKCAFCSAHKVWGPAYRFRSVANVVKEMRLLRDRYGIEELMFEDDNVTANAVRAKELFSRMIDEKFGFVWDTPNGIGIWSMDEEMIDLMKRSGCVKLNFPVESGSQRVLDEVIKKPVKLSRIKHLIGHCKKIGLDHEMFLVVGMPGETIKDMWSSFRYAAGCGCYEPHISVATPYPGTQLFEECRQKGFFAREFKLDDLFIRSFMVRTPEWSEIKLEKTLSKGLLYLKVKSLLADPVKSFKRLGRAITHPLVILNFLKDVSEAFRFNKCKGKAL